MESTDQGAIEMVLTALQITVPILTLAVGVYVGCVSESLYGN